MMAFLAVHTQWVYDKGIEQLNAVRPKPDLEWHKACPVFIAELNRIGRIFRRRIRLNLSAAGVFISLDLTSVIFQDLQSFLSSVHEFLDKQFENANRLIVDSKVHDNFIHKMESIRHFVNGKNDLTGLQQFQTIVNRRMSDLFAEIREVCLFMFFIWIESI